jgi:hypothetical protein
MTISVAIHDVQCFKGTVASGSATQTFSLTIANDATSVFIARIVCSHFSGGHQNAGGSIMASGTFEGQNGSYTLVPHQATAGGPVGANPANDYYDVPAAGDTIICGTGGTLPFTAVWSLSGSTALMTITNQTGSTAGFDFAAWVDIYTAAST